MELEKEMPYFLRHNEIMIEKKLYLRNKLDIMDFNHYSPAYLITTENINGYYDLMNFENKDVLTVIGSSDQVFESILRGARNVDAFDISIYAIMFYYLKEAAIKALSYEEYIKFFYLLNDSFNKRIFYKIIPYLNSRAVSFWKLIFKANNPRKVILSPHITENAYSINNFLVTDALKNVSSYLSKDNFYLLKAKINKINIRIFLNEAKSLDDIDGVYDYIILSNIIDYQHNYYYYFMEAISRYTDKLKENGEIKAAYLYRNPTDYEINHFEISEIAHYLEALTNKEYATKHYILTKKKNN